MFPLFSHSIDTSLLENYHWFKSLVFLLDYEPAGDKQQVIVISLSFLYCSAPNKPSEKCVLIQYSQVRMGITLAGGQENPGQGA